MIAAASGAKGGATRVMKPVLAAATIGSAFLAGLRRLLTRVPARFKLSSSELNFFVKLRFFFIFAACVC